MHRRHGWLDASSLCLPSTASINVSKTLLTCSKFVIMPPLSTCTIMLAIHLVGRLSSVMIIKLASHTSLNVHMYTGSLHVSECHIFCHSATQSLHACIICSFKECVAHHHFYFHFDQLWAKRAGNQVPTRRGTRS